MDELQTGATKAAPAPTPDTGEEEPAAPASDPRIASYGLGLQMGRNFKFQEFEVDLELMLQGVKDGLAGSRPRFGAEEIQTAIQTSQLEAAKAIAARNRTLGEAYLAANALEQGVFNLPSGLQYEVLIAGDGPKPTAADTVAVRYRTSLINGNVIEDTFGEPEPRTVAVSTLVPGWREALELMSVGSTWRLFVPPGLAHGDQGSGAIGPGATTIFVIELVEVLRGEAAPSTPAAQQPAPVQGTGAASAGSEEPTLDQLRATVHAWARAWADQRPDDYLAFYSSGFRPPNGMSRADWEALRRERISNPRFIEIELGSLDVRLLEAERALATFDQSYRSSSNSDQVTKTLELIRRGSGWEILAERVEQQGT